MTLNALSWKTKAGYGLNDLGVNFYLSIISFWLFVYLTDILGLSPSLAAVAVIIGRVFEALSVPLIGYWSDRYTTRWGRLRPYLLIGAIPSFITMALLFGVPDFHSEHAILVWVSITFSLASIVNCFVSVPYSAMTAIITEDYHERTSLNAWRMLFSFCGMLLATVGCEFIIDAGGSPRAGFAIIGYGGGFMMMATALITFRAVREPDCTNSSASKRHIIQDLLVPFRNRAFLSVLLSYVAFQSALTMVGGTLIYYFKYVFHAEAMVPFAFGAFIICTLLFVPIWVPISRKIGKKWSLTLGMLNLSFVGLIFFFFGHHLPMLIALAVIAFGGIGLAAGYVFPWSMLPDTITLHLADTGEQRDGLYYSTWTFMGKVGQFTGAFFIGLVLSLTGYLPSTTGNLQQPESAIFGIRLLLGIIPAIIYLASAVIIQWYPLTEAKCREMLARIR